MIENFPFESEEEYRQRVKFEEFFGNYTDSVRQILISKNVPNPKNLYDAYKIRKDNLARNQTISANLDENSQYLRSVLLSKNVDNIIDPDKISKEIRETLISKNILLNTDKDLEELSEKTRLSLLAKNESQLYGKLDRTGKLSKCSVK